MRVYMIKDAYIRNERVDINKTFAEKVFLKDRLFALPLIWMRTLIFWSHITPMNRRVY